MTLFESAMFLVKAVPAKCQSMCNMYNWPKRVMLQDFFLPTKRSEKINKPSWLSKYYLYPCKNVWNTFELWIWFKHSSGAHIFQNFVNSGEVSSPQDTFEHLPKILLFLRPCPSILLKLLQTFQNRFWTSCPNVHHFFCKRPGLFLVCS